RCCQLISPEICCWKIPSMWNRSQSKSFSEDTFHQNVSVPGPVTVVSSHDSWLSKTNPLCAASTPSCVAEERPDHKALPPVIQTRLGSSSASSRLVFVSTMEIVAVFGDPTNTHALSEAVMVTVTVSGPSTAVSGMCVKVRVELI